MAAPNPVARTKSPSPRDRGQRVSSRPTSSRSTGRLDPSTALADALSDVAQAGDRLITNRFELFRLEIRGDLKRITRGLASIILGALALVAGLSLLGIAGATALRPWIPFPLTLSLVGLILGGAGWWLRRDATERMDIKPPAAVVPPVDPSPAVEKKAEAIEAVPIPAENVSPSSAPSYSPISPPSHPSPSQS